MPDKPRIGWIGIGRMGYPMAERLLRAGYDVSIWNRTRAKAEPLAAAGGKIVDHASDLAGVDVLFSIVSTGKDIEQVYFGAGGVGAANRIPPSAAGSPSAARISCAARSAATPRSSMPASSPRWRRGRRRRFAPSSRW
jgi:3-hydroxyisobutyrate dehydrogenase-like beta-hydroxyacid dehydrogenase